MSLLHRARREGDRFLNPVPTELFGPRLTARVLPLYLSNREQRIPAHALSYPTDTVIYRREPPTGLRVTWFGHSGALFEVDGVRLLLDPVWDERASPSSLVGPRRFFPPTMALADLPALDAVLISHDHYDHLGARTVRSLSRLACAQSAQWITSLGVGAILQRLGVPARQIEEMDWTDSRTVRSQRTGGLVELTAYPARHFSGRGLHDRMRTLWSSFVVAGTHHTLYLGADSGWWPGFTEIAARHPPFDLTLLEIGAFHELWKSIHLGPDGAAQAFADMGSPGLLMPVHWGLFDLALHAWQQPITRLLEIADRRGLRLWSPTPGEPADVVAGQELRSLWWAEP